MRRRLHYLWRVFAERHDEAWLAGRADADAEIEAIIDDKDAFIEVQSELIRSVMDVLDQANLWAYVPDHLAGVLADYR